MVYDQSGDKVNSIMSTATIEMREETYRAMLQRGAVVQQTIAIPAKGNYFLRLGVHEIGSDQVGALELPLAVGVVLIPAAPVWHWLGVMFKGGRESFWTAWDRSR